MHQSREKEWKEFAMQEICGIFRLNEICGSFVVEPSRCKLKANKKKL